MDLKVARTYVKWIWTNDIITIKKNKISVLGARISNTIEAS